LLLGFTNLTDRPLIWLAQGTVLGLTLAGRSWRNLRNGQIVCLVLTVLVLAGLTALVSGAAGPGAWSVIAVGLSPQGTVQEQTTVLSFPHFWPPDNWEATTSNATKSIFADLIHAPGAFVQW